MSDVETHYYGDGHDHGVLLTREEAVLAARCARSFRGDRPRDITELPSLEPGSVYEQLRLLAEKCEAAT